MYILAAETVLRNRFAIMPTAMHLIFCLFATVVFAAIFIRKKTVSSLIWLLICDTTAVLQFFGDKLTATAVAVCEIFLFAMLIVISIREKKAAAIKKAAEENGEEELAATFPEDLKDIDKLIKSESQNIPDNSDDMIHNAFEDDHR